MIIIKYIRLFVIILALILNLQSISNADDTNSNAKICIDIGFEVDSEKYIKCKQDLENHYNKKQSEDLKNKLINKSQKKNMSIDFGCFNRCKDSVKGMSITMIDSFCRKQCIID